MTDANLYTAYHGSDQTKCNVVTALSRNAITFAQTKTFGIARHIIAATDAIGSQLSNHLKSEWPEKVAEAIRPNSQVGLSWWLFAQWMLGKISQVLPQDSSEYQFCDEVEVMYDLGCNSTQAWQKLIARMDEVPVEDKDSALGAAVAAYKQLARTALALTIASNASIEQLAEDHDDHIVSSLELTCNAILHSGRYPDRSAVYERMSAKFLHAISKG